MKTQRNLIQPKWLLAALLMVNLTTAHATDPDTAKKPEAIPWDQIGAKAGANYKGDALAVTPTADGARLHCAFQKLDGTATGEGLWLSSTVTNNANDRFQVKAVSVERVSPSAPGMANKISTPQSSSFETELDATGNIDLAGQSVRFTRPGLVEEYSVSMDGVRQDFVVLEKPAGTGELQTRLAVSGATVEPTAGGVQLVLEKSGRKIAYNRLRVTDATGKELSARMEVPNKSATGVPQSDFALAVAVNDTEAVYPVRIDPTFSDANWVIVNPTLAGTDNIVSALAMDGSGNVYAGGFFTVAGGIAANRIAKWNGSSWSTLGSGMNNSVSALALDGSGNVYAGGSFTSATNSDNAAVSANYIAQWNGSSWSALGSGMNNSVSALALDGSGNLYAGGFFTSATNSGNVAVPANRIAQWNGSSWSALGSGMNNTVNALALDGSGNLYAGGSFTSAGGSAASYIAIWNGSSWSPLGLGMNNTVYALAVGGSGNVYAGGTFTAVTNSGNVVVSANRIAIWNGSSWSALGSGMNGSVYALAMDGSGNLYAGGNFQSPSSCIAKWNGSSWSALGSGLNSIVYALAPDGSGNVYAGGFFTTAGGIGAIRIAKWNGSSWSALGSGINDYVSALAVDSSGNLYVGGSFITAGGIAASYIAKWNGNSWSTLGSGLNNAVNALALDGSGNLYAGGGFTTAGGVTANRIAKWNGSSWSTLGLGLNNIVNALAADGSGNLYVGGQFTTVTNTGNVVISANRIAKWNGSSWSALGLGLNGPVVYSLALDGSGNLYVGGQFTTATNSGNVAVSASYIAKWNGSSWSTLGLGLNNIVNALAVDKLGNVYVGGNPTTATNSDNAAVSASYIAQWNGSSWSALGSGLNSTVKALAVDKLGNVFAGGYFSKAGGKVSPYVAEALFAIPPTITTQPTNQAVMVTSNVAFSVTATGDAPLAYQWFKNTAKLANGGNASGVTSNTLTLTNVYVADPGYYLVVVTNIAGSATSSVVSLTVSNLPLVMPGGKGSLAYANKQFWLTVSGPVSSNAVIFASTNLQNWIPLVTNPLTIGSLMFTDVLATNFTQRFYRATLTP